MNFRATKEKTDTRKEIPFEQNVQGTKVQLPRNPAGANKTPKHLDTQARAVTVTNFPALCRGLKALAQPGELSTPARSCR
jgi:hypothetical protein